MCCLTVKGLIKLGSRKSSHLLFFCWVTSKYPGQGKKNKIRFNNFNYCFKSEMVTKLLERENE